MKRFLKGLLCSILTLICIFKVPDIHYNWLRSKVSSRVVEITNPEKNHGSTGFHVKAPSGKTYILTNSHVCSHTQQDGLVTVSDTNDNSIPRRILYNSPYTDLCIVEGMPGAEGLSLGGEPSPGQIVAVVGHPQLLPITLSRGEVIAEGDNQIFDHLMIPGDSADTCSAPKNKIEEIQFFGEPVKVCTVKIRAYYSNVTILGGNSGSPVVDFFGRVVGVAFAASSESNWGEFVTMPDIIKTLKAF